MDVLEIPYRARLSRFALPIGFFVVAAAGLAYAAATNTRGMVLNGLVELSPRGASTVYAVLSVAAVGMVAFALSALGVGAGASRAVRLDAEALIAPKHAFARRATVVPLSSVRGMEILRMQGQTLLSVQHAAGTLHIAASMLPDAADLDRLYATLRARIEEKPNTTIDRPVHPA